MSKKRANVERWRAKRSLMDGLSTKVFDKDGKIVFNGRDNADALIREIKPLGGK